jgi:hypothetical protein
MGGRLIPILVVLARRASPSRGVRRMAAWGGSLRAGKRRRSSIALLEASPLFDGDWYVRKYTDVAAAGADPAWHYITLGWREGRDPGPLFSTKAYLRANKDVVLSGANPLLHFIEHGLSEGRGTTKHRAMLIRAASPGEPFGDAAPCASFPVGPDRPVRWPRTSRLNPADEDMLTIGDLPLGRLPDAKQKADVEAAFALLRRLSGSSGEGAFSVKADSDGTLLDSWYIERNRLRTRWESPLVPIVVRAYQVDTDRDDQVALVGEGLAAGPIDFVDVLLCNRYFPLLFVLSGANGEVWECHLLAFPSLCRGAPHYPELLALSQREGKRSVAQIDVLRHSQALAERLLAVSDRGAAPLVSGLAVDLAGADGTELLFDPEFRIWLTRVARIGIDSHEPGQSGFLASTVRLPADGTRSAAGGTLVLAGDMIPTISILSAVAAQDAKRLPETSLSLIVASAEPSQPATLFEIPEGVAALQSRSPDFPAAWPQLVARKQSPLPEQGVAAIRLTSGRELTDAELLFPVPAPSLAMSSALRSITWLIRMAGSGADLLAPTIQSLASQACSGGDRIILVGEPELAVTELAETLFGSRVRQFAEVETAASTIETELVGYVGAGVILHDVGSAELLRSLLDDPAIETASCPLVHAESAGFNWQVELVDAGYAATAAISSADAQRLWRADYPVANPPRDLWVARTSSLTRWIDSDAPLQPAEGTHVCTSFITASLLTFQLDETERRRPPIPMGRSIRAEALFG